MAKRYVLGLKVDGKEVVTEDTPPQRYWNKSEKLAQAYCDGVNAGIHLFAMQLMSRRFYVKEIDEGGEH